MNFFTETIPNAFNNFLDFLKGIMEFVVAYIKDPIGTIKELLHELLPKIKEWAESMIGKIKDAFGKIKEVGTNLVKGLFNGIKDATQ